MSICEDKLICLGEKERCHQNVIGTPEHGIKCLKISCSDAAGKNHALQLELGVTAQKTKLGAIGRVQNF